MELVLRYQLPSSAYVTASRSVTAKEHSFERELNAAGVYPTLPNSCQWLTEKGGNYILLQVASSTGKALGQVVVYINSPKKAPWYKWGNIERWGGLFLDIKVEAEFLSYLDKIIKLFSNISHIDISFYALEDKLEHKVAIAQASPLLPKELTTTYRRTAYCTVESDADIYLKSLSYKTRAKIKHKSRNDLLIRKVTDIAQASLLQACLDASFARTGGVSQRFDFENFINLANRHPERCLVLRLSFVDSPDAILAYSVDVRHGHVIEAVSSGSLLDARLRKTHFNYYLFWEKYLWASQIGARYIDLGGITHGGEDDPLASISSFKRQLTELEKEVSLQYQVITKPTSYKAYRIVDKIARMI